MVRVRHVVTLRPGGLQSFFDDCVRTSIQILVLVTLI
jgi:hypothetical protein